LANNVKKLVNLFVFSFNCWAKCGCMKQVWTIWCFAESSLNLRMVYVKHTIFFSFRWCIPSFNFYKRHLFIDDLDTNFNIIEGATLVVVYQLWRELLLFLPLIVNGDADAWRKTSCSKREIMTRDFLFWGR
jgi:hypothetical protein